MEDDWKKYIISGIFGGYNKNWYTAPFERVKHLC